MAFDPNTHFAQTALLSKINIGGNVYYVKDAEARAALEAEINKLGTAAYKSYAATMSDAGLADAATVKAYVDAQVGSINKFDVVIDTNGTAVAGPSVTASADTMYKLYLIPATDASAGEYLEFITIRTGAEGAYTYKWEQIGSTKLSLTGYVTEEALAIELAKYEPKDNLGDLAYKDNAQGTVEGQTISGVKATGTSAGSIAVALTESDAEIVSAGKFTPAGNVTGSVVASGDVAVALDQTSTQATLTKGDYTPAGAVTANFSHTATAAELTKSTVTPTGKVSVALSGATFNAITGVGTQASFQEGAFTPASLTYAESDAFAKEGLVGEVDGETLVLTAAGTGKASVISAFSGGSKAADTFTANSLPTMAEQTVGVESATFAGDAHDTITGVSYDKAALSDLAFTGTKVEGALVTGVAYDKASVSSATFTGKAADITAAFAGTEADVAVTGKGKTYAVDAENTKFTGADIELAVGNIVVAEKQVTVQ